VEPLIRLAEMMEIFTFNIHSNMQVTPLVNPGYVYSHLGWLLELKSENSGVSAKLIWTFNSDVTCGSKNLEELSELIEFAKNHCIANNLNW
jgi:hypothetical protein